MSRFTGTGSLVRLILRRDRVRLPVWLVALVGLVLMQAASIDGLYATQAELAEAAAPLRDNAAVIAMAGPAQAIETLGGRITWEVAAFGAVLVALMSLFLVVRHTRAEEETGRAELLRATVLGRHAHATAVLVVMAGANVVVTLAVASGLTGVVGLDATGAWALGAGLGSAGLVFGAFAVMAAQVTENARAASGITGAVIGAAYVVRAIGDVGDGTLSWLSPLGWVFKLRPFAGERWWVLGLVLAAIVVLVAVAFALETRRDLGAGLVASRPGRPRASDGLARPLGLALRLQRGGLVAWTVGLFLGGLAYGSMGQDIEELVGDDDDVADIIAQGGAGNLTDSFFATAALLLALIGAGYALSSALRLRGEETAGRAEPLLATAVERTRWMAGHLVLAVAGSAVVLGAAGLGTGLAHGIGVGDAGEVPRLTGAALVHLPAVWVLIGVAVALFGLLPRATPVVWAVLAACAAIGVLGTVLDVPEWTKDLSPFQHVPQVPAADVSLAPLAVLTAIAAALVAVGLAGFRRRDLA